MITWALIGASACREAVARLARGRVADVTDGDRQWLDGGYGGNGDGGGGGYGGGGYGVDGVDGGYGGGGGGGGYGGYGGGGGGGGGYGGGYGGDGDGDGGGYGGGVVAVTLCDGTVLRGADGAKQWLRAELDRRMAVL